MKYKIGITSLRKFETPGFDRPWEEEIYPQFDSETDEFVISGTYEFGNPIKFEQLISQLAELKRLGANYISLEYHEDHGSYLIEGLKIEKLGLGTLTKEEEKAAREEIKRLEDENREMQQELVKNVNRRKELTELLKDAKKENL
jgi:vacuolar-type H+-ATPase subunit I/STV1